eukprot:m.801614 g.801614  ORF g.801614 m.801614 type:complete len:1472 (+) comp59272_c0_seq61:311-4726(+)
MHDTHSDLTPPTAPSAHPSDLGLSHFQMANSALLLLAIVALAATAYAQVVPIIHEPGRCVWYGQCGLGSQGYYDCLNNSLAATNPDPTFYALLVETCPYLALGGIDNSPVCCDYNMLNTLATSVGVARSLMSGCPACMSNFMKMWCGVTCGPDQSQFMIVESTAPFTPTDSSQSNESVTSVAYLLSSNFTTPFFDSCKDVQFPSGNSKMLGAICGRSAESCTVEDLLSFLGSTTNGQAPFDIDMYIDNIPCNPNSPVITQYLNFVNQSDMNYPTFGCNESDPTACNSGTCSCQDCPSVCLPQPPRVVTPPCMNGGLGCYTFMIVVGYGSFLGLLLLGFAIYFAFFQPKSFEFDPQLALSNEEDDEDSTFGERRDYDGALRVGLVEAILRMWFTRWGRFCGKYSALIIIASIVICIGLTLGNLKFTVMNDPVQLWSSPDSTSRQQKDIFDESFGPFYRTSQIILRAPEVQGEVYQSYDNTGIDETDVYFSGMFNRQVLIEIFDLQNQILNLTAEHDGRVVTLADVCLRPLCNDTATSRDPNCGIANCTIFSPLNWFQNNLNTLLLESCPNTCSLDAPWEYSTMGPNTTTTGAPEYSSALCGMADEVNGTYTCNCGCGPCQISTTSTTTSTPPMWGCCTCPPKYSFFGSLPSWDYRDHMMYCASAVTALNDPRSGVNLGSCLGTYGGPIYPNVALGGYDCEQNNETGTPICNYMNATAIILTLPLVNHVDEDLNGPAEAWEKVFLDFMDNLNSTFDIAYSAERSISDELARSSAADEVTIVISYLLMFLYVSITLGSFPTSAELCGPKCFSHLVVRSRVLLGLAGVIIVLLSVGSSLGLWSAAGFDATLIVVEVVPFLTLAVGVDNIFILVHSFEDTYHSGRDASARLSMVLGEVGPSILLCSLSETVAFAIGSLSSMPAVKTFALFAAGAVFIDFLLQISLFACLLLLDARRGEAHRCDCCPCVPLDIPEQEHSPSKIKHITNFLAKVILSPWIALPLFILSTAGFALGLYGMTFVNVGLNQQLALPSDSYVNKYFDFINDYLEVGAPVYFVVSGANFTTIPSQNMVCGGHPGCSQNSIVSQAFLASGSPNFSYIALPVSSWIDDYIDWIDPASGCCQVFNQNVTVGSTTYQPGDFCTSTLGTSFRAANCITCPSVASCARPTGEVFSDYLGFFLRDVPNINCAKAGHAAYGDALVTQGDVNSPVASPLEVERSYFMTYHTKLVTSTDFTDALREARALTEKVSAADGVSVFPYSVFYVFYEQYLTIVHDTLESLGICLAAIFVISSVLLGSFWAGGIIILTITMIIIDMIGMMYVWGIDLNAISLVNLVMAIGISVEFVAHITRAFCLAAGTRRKRAATALRKMGSNVISGITCTKFAGIIVLAFADSQIFQVFYFRMYVLMVVLGVYHGLIFLPITLSLFGPPERQENTTILSCLLNQPEAEGDARNIQRQSDEHSPLLREQRSGPRRIA